MGAAISQQIWSQHQSYRTLQIDVEFRNLIPPPSNEEKLQLETNLKEFGCIDPLIVWQSTDILLDGHNRYEICTRVGIFYKIVEIELPDRDAAICWIANHQLGRRNITPETGSYLRGKQYLHLKGNREGNLKQNLPNGKNFLSVEDHLDENLPNGKNFLSVENHLDENLPNGKNPKKVDVAKHLAQQYKVTDRTIRNDARFADAVDVLVSSFGFFVKNDILSRTAKLTKKEILSLASIVTTSGKEVAQAVLDKKFNKTDIVQQIKDKQRVPNPHYVGQVCQIIARGDASLKKVSGCWAIIIQVNLHSCCISTWKMDFPTVKPENLKPCYGVDEKIAAQNCLRIRRLVDKIYAEYDRTHAAVLESLGSEADPSRLTPKQERILAFLEWEYGLTNENPVTE